MGSPSKAKAPFSEPLFPQLDLPSNPYYKPWHYELRATVRRYVDEELAPHAHEWENAGQVPEEVRLRHCALGYAVTQPIIEADDAGGVPLPGNVPYDEWDTWCSMIVADEISRMGYTGVAWGLGGGNSIGCPPVSRFGGREQRQRWLPHVATGQLRFCLGITEPDGGIKTTAVRDGNEFVVNGAKKWITNGMWADYCTAAVRTGGKGHGGISLLVVPLKAKGVTTRRMENSGVNASGQSTSVSVLISLLFVSAFDPHA
jgi:alkylation response protein AidB-like acyl-CoA dehydrogenase